jgi:hypothetical protein
MSSTSSFKCNSLEDKGEVQPKDSGGDARSSIGKHASRVLRDRLGEPQMQRVARSR